MLAQPRYENTDRDGNIKIQSHIGTKTKRQKSETKVVKTNEEFDNFDPVLSDDESNKRNIVVSDQSGRSNILSRLEKLNIKINKDDPKVQKLLEQVKDREFIGYAYDGADASFELLMFILILMRDIINVDISILGIILCL